MNILIVKLSSIGDIVHTLPALALLRRAFPQAHISWVVEQAMGEILRENPMIDDLIELDTRGWRKRLASKQTWLEVQERVTALRRVRYDLGFDFQGLLKSGLVLFLSGARRRIGFDNATLKEKASRVFLTVQVPVEHCEHVIERNLELVRSVVVESLFYSGETPERKSQKSEARSQEPALRVEYSGFWSLASGFRSYEFPIYVSDRDRESVSERLRALGLSDFAIMNPGGGWSAKRWPPPQFGKIADFLKTHYSLVSLVTYGPGEAHLADEVVCASQLSAALAFPCTLKQLAALADQAHLFIGGDTGPLHIAAARGTPIVALYGPTPAKRNGPFDPNDQVVERPPISGYRYYSRRNRGDEGLGIQIEEVKTAIERRMRLTRYKAGTD